MTTLIRAYNSEGLVGKCDAACYNAKLPECVCICGGRNHGAGLQQAMANTQALAELWLAEYAQRTGQKIERFEVNAL